MPSNVSISRGAERPPGPAGGGARRAGGARQSRPRGASGMGGVGFLAAAVSDGGKDGQQGRCREKDWALPSGHQLAREPAQHVERVPVPDRPCRARSAGVLIQDGQGGPGLLCRADADADADADAGPTQAGIPPPQRWDPGSGIPGQSTCAMLLGSRPLGHFFP